MATGQHRSWLHILGFTVITVIVVYVVLDIEYRVPVLSALKPLTRF
jgi:hypothetical protein